MRATKRQCGWASLALCGAASAFTPPTAGDHLGELSLEDLSNIEITSVSRRAERLSGAPTSVYVITGADIRRSGATTLAEALRLAPNLQVVRVNAKSYTASARGFASPAANKLLVLIDGRSVYSPLFSGVFWDVQEVMLEDVDRIEVISGPGSTLWGVNAVNGVINVITRSALATPGSLAALGAGSQESRASVRHGTHADEGSAWRLYALRSDVRDTKTASGTRVNDAGHHTQVGLRADAERGPDHFAVHAEAYEGRREQPLPGSIVTGAAFELGDIRVSGAHVLGLWERSLDAGASLQLQAGLDHTERTVVPTFSDRQDLLDLQLQHSPGALGRHTPVWGAQLRAGWDHTINSPYIAFLPERLRQTWASLFVQDEIALDDELRLTLGARAERNDYTGIEFLPTARLAWKWAPQQLVWAAASRTVRAPSRLDHDPYVPGQPPFLLRGGPGVASEVADVVGLGYRGQPAPGTTLSATAYHAEYDRLRTQEIDPAFTYLYFGNGMQGRTSGLELWASLQASPSWRLHAGFSRLWQDMRLKPGSDDTQAVAATEGANPPLWWSLRSAVDLNPQTDLDLTVRHVGALAQPAVPGYTTLDLRVAWRPRPGLELSLTGQNLAGGGHGEFYDVAVRTQWQRSWFAQLTAAF
jgi:iron complex outermembrane receptor protein